ncbi:MAG: hypothetical protein EOM11_09405, partial [Erysipelotrichia bacterium]|nr:hypothetical protein [Erysipelotrichia bacterium]
MAKVNVSVKEIKEFIELSKQSIDTGNLNRSISNIVSALSIMNQFASKAKATDLTGIKKQYTELFELVKKIESLNSGDGGSKNKKEKDLSGSFNATRKSIDTLEDNLMGTYGRTKKEAEKLVKKQRELNSLLKDETKSNNEKYEISRKINILNKQALEVVRNIRKEEKASENSRLTPTMGKRISQPKVKGLSGVVDSTNNLVIT